MSPIFFYIPAFVCIAGFLCFSMALRVHQVRSSLRQIPSFYEAWLYFAFLIVFEGFPLFLPAYIYIFWGAAASFFVASLWWAIVEFRKDTPQSQRADRITN